MLQKITAEIRLARLLSQRRRAKRSARVGRAQTPADDSRTSGSGYFCGEGEERQRQDIDSSIVSGHSSIPRNKEKAVFLLERALEYKNSKVPPEMRFDGDGKPKGRKSPEMSSSGPASLPISETHDVTTLISPESGGEADLHECQRFDSISFENNVEVDDETEAMRSV